MWEIIRTIRQFYCNVCGAILKKKPHVDVANDSKKEKSKHKHKLPRVKVYFKHKRRYYMLFEAINIGKKDTPELKLKGFADTYIQIKDDQNRFDGKLHPGQYIRFVDGDHVEFTYHKDGSILNKTVNPSNKNEYSNPYGKDVKWTPINEITVFQPVMKLFIRSFASYHPASLEENQGLTNYIVKSDRLFDLTGGKIAVVLIYLKKKNYPLARYCIDDITYSDVIMNFGEELELCILVLKKPDDKEQDPFIGNSFLFIDRLEEYDNLNKALHDHVFDVPFVEFLEVIQKDNRYFNVSEQMLVAMKPVDLFYKNLEISNVLPRIHKYELIRRLYDKLDGKYGRFVKWSEEKQLRYVEMLYRKYK